MGASETAPRHAVDVTARATDEPSYVFLPGSCTSTRQPVHVKSPRALLSPAPSPRGVASYDSLELDLARCDAGTHREVLSESRQRLDELALLGHDHGHLEVIDPHLISPAPHEPAIRAHDR